MPKHELVESLGLDQYKYDFVDEEKSVFRTQPGLSADIVRQISFASSKLTASSASHNSNRAWCRP
jgi:hypothetical protein